MPLLSRLASLGIHWCASPPAAPTTTRTSSGRRSSRRPTAICRRKIRWWASRGRSTRPRASRRAIPSWCSSAGYSYLQEYLPHVAQPWSAPAWSTSSAWAAWCSPIPTCPPTCWPARRSRQAALPHLQRLHDRPAQRPGLRLLSARSVLRQAPPRHRAQGTEEEGESVAGSPHAQACLEVFLQPGSQKHARRAQSAHVRDYLVANLTRDDRVASEEVLDAAQ